MSDKMPISTRVKLSAMMFLQFMMFAVFWAQLAPYITSSGWDSVKFWMLSTMPLGAIASPLIGMVADRFFNSEKVLAFSNVVCGIMLFMAGRVAVTSTNGVDVFIYLLIAMIFYMPSWGLTAAIAMNNSPAEQFPQIRVFGSIGWVASVLFSVVGLKVFGKQIDGTNIPFYCGAAASIAAAAVALMLPETPPPAKGQKMSAVDALGLKAFSLMKEKNFAVFILVSFVAMIPFNIHFVFLGDFLAAKGFKLLTFTTYIGQAAEILLMLLVTVCLRKFGVKWSIVAGLAALVVRYGAYYLGAGDMVSAIYIGILVHGIIFGFFIVGGQVYVGKVAPPEMQAQAQGFYGLVMFGLGSFLGTFVNNRMINFYTERTDAGVLQGSWDKVWLVSMGISIAMLIVMVIFFNPKCDKETAEA
ncbi:MAG: MFS transporter [Kiritimatiellae bacterium]|jgi:nucleoside transporter|nr:MFS transporter [Kiritimatiellia bacterium]